MNFKHLENASGRLASGFLRRLGLQVTDFLRDLWTAAVTAAPSPGPSSCDEVCLFLSALLASAHAQAYRTSAGAREVSVSRSGSPLPKTPYTHSETP